MRTIVDENYGADADGNRVMRLVEYEIDEDDYDDIRFQIEENYDGELYTDITNIYLGEEGIEFTVAIEEYFTIDEFVKFASEYWDEGDEELAELIKLRREEWKKNEDG